MSIPEQMKPVVDELPELADEAMAIGIVVIGGDGLLRTRFVYLGGTGPGGNALLYLAGGAHCLAADLAAHMNALAPAITSADSGAASKH